MVKQNTKNQVWLSLIFMIVILGNFVSIAGISYYYENYNVDGIHELFVTDSNTEFNHVNFGVGWPINHQDNYTSSYYYTVGGLWVTDQKFPSYLGNDTWGFSVNTTNTNANAKAVIDLPNLSQWIITSIDVNLSLPGDIDERILLTFTNFDSPWPHGTGLTTRPYDQSKTLITETDIHETVSLSEALEINSNSKVNDINSFDITVRDDILDGMTGFAFQFRVTIYGKTAETWSMYNAILISTTVWNILIGLTIVYSFDKYDLGGFVKTIREKRRN